MAAIGDPQGLYRTLSAEKVWWQLHSLRTKSAIIMYIKRPEMMSIRANTIRRLSGRLTIILLSKFI